jgi:regulator of nucleoside diphosphate kinase
MPAIIRRGVINMEQRTIFITKSDMKQLRSLLEAAENSLRRDQENLKQLEDELDRAEVVAEAQLPHDVVTMNSRVVVEDLDTARISEYELVFPRNSDMSRSRISVLAPIGTALLGYRTGDIIEWEVPAGRKRLKIIQVTYQPEAAGDVAC